MHRTRVNAVAGKKALAEGKWLTVIGNRRVHSGDWVWTDGRCIYGHESAGGSAPVLVKRGESGVPVYVGARHCIYQRGELRNLHVDYEYRGLLYLGAHAAHLLPHPYPQRESSSFLMQTWTQLGIFLRLRVFIGYWLKTGYGQGLWDLSM